MRREALVIALALFVSAPVALSAQARPDFSGKWILDTTSGPAPEGAVELTVKQDAKTLTLTRRQGDQTTTEIHNLDGTETRETIQALGGTRERVSRATWDGNKLVINATLSVDGKILQQNRVMSMEGGNLVIEQIGPAGGGPATIKRVFKKK